MNFGKRLECFNKAIAIREASLSRDPQNARSRTLLAGNYAERGTQFLRRRPIDRCASGHAEGARSGELDRRGGPEGHSYAIRDGRFSKRLASLHATLAKQGGGGGSREYHRREAAKYFRRADAFYMALAGEGMLNSAQLRAMQTCRRRRTLRRPDVPRRN